MKDSTKLLVMTFAIEGSAGFQSCAVSLVQDDLIASFSEILNMYLSDPESSRLRTLATLFVAGYEPNEAKLGGEVRSGQSDGARGRVTPSKSSRRKKNN